jgi:hypothetical protein
LFNDKDDDVEENRRFYHSFWMVFVYDAKIVNGPKEMKMDKMMNKNDAIMQMT